jgi:hypothetical protein
MTKYYKVVIKSITEVLPKKGPAVEKVTKSEILVEAVSVGDAETKAHQYLSGSISDIEISSVSETKIEAVVK